MSMTFATNIEADGNNTRKIGTSTNKFILNDTGNCAAFYGTCSTAAATAEKAVTCAEFSNANLVSGTTIRIKFTYANGKASPTLKINGGTAKAIYRYGTTTPSTSAATSWNAGAIVDFTYDGSAWFINGWINDNTTTTVDQLAVITTNGEYSLLHANDTGTAKKGASTTYKSSATINPSTGQITMKGKPVMIGEYSASTAPASPVTGQVWLKQPSMLIDEAKILILTTSASALPTTVTNSAIKSDMIVLKCDLSYPPAQGSDLTITTNDGSLTIAGTLNDATAITLYLLRSR